jgi:hypothetical protein
VLALVLAERARDRQAVLVDLQFDVVPGDPGELGLDQVELLGLVDLDVRLPGRLLRTLLGDLLLEPSHALPQVLVLADRVPQRRGLEQRRNSRAVLPSGGAPGDVGADSGAAAYPGDCDGVNGAVGVNRLS